MEDEDPLPRPLVNSKGGEMLGEYLSYHEN